MFVIVVVVRLFEMIIPNSESTHEQELRHSGKANNNIFSSKQREDFVKVDECISQRRSKRNQEKVREQFGMVVRDRCHRTITGERFEGRGGA